jgi:hypothetical protein
VDIQRNFWFSLAVLVSAIAMFMWAASSIGNSDNGWVPWPASAAVVVAGGGFALRAWFRAKRVLPTEQRQATKLLDERLETKQSFWQLTHAALLFLGVLSLMLLEDYGWLPGWAAATLILVLVAG